MTTTLSVFTADQEARAHRLLATKAVFMDGRKFEEGDWQEVYCGAKDIPIEGWSNLNIDVTYGNVGVEHKMLRKESGRPLTYWCGQTLMHPAATRAIRPKTGVDADDAMTDVFAQYKVLLDARAARVREVSGTEPDMRTGWLLWQESLRQFLYFEEPTLAPDPAQYFARWTTNESRGARLGSRNLWIYERATGTKRFSITTAAGAKIQPYFDVPPLGAEHLYLFTVQGEPTESGLVRVWVSLATARDLEEVAGGLSPQHLTDAIERAKPPEGAEDAQKETSLVRAVEVPSNSYVTLRAKFDAVSDEQCMRLVVAALRRPSSSTGA